MEKTGAEYAAEVTPTIKKADGIETPQSGKKNSGKRVVKKKGKTDPQPVKVEVKTESTVGETPKAKYGVEKSDAEATPKTPASNQNDTPGGSKPSSKKKRKRVKKDQQTPNKKQSATANENSNTPATQEKKVQTVKPNPQKDEKLGGLIFMCNNITKGDCFHYGVFGLPAQRQDIVLQIRPGFKLFLYDIDSKLIHGVFEASSPGGLKLEPAAFRGNFPAQVRFKILKESQPLPENEFRKGIEEIFDSRKKFKPELTFPQAKKLAKLFRAIDGGPRQQNNAVVYEREAYFNKAAPPPVFLEEEFRRDAFIPEKEYHPYAIREPYLVPARNVLPLEPAYVEGPPPPLIRREHIPREPVLIKEDPGLYAPIGAYEYPQPPSAVQHQPPPGYHAAYRREEALPPPSSVGPPARNGGYYQPEYAPPAEPYQRVESGASYPLATRGGAEYREADVVERYARYDPNAAGARVEYVPAPRMPQEQARGEAGFVPVSSRYSFAGPPPSYR